MVELLLEKVGDPEEGWRLNEIKAVLETPDGPPSALRAAIDAGGYDVLQLLDECPSCKLNIFEFLQVARPGQAPRGGRARLAPAGGRRLRVRVRLPADA